MRKLALATGAALTAAALALAAPAAAYADGYHDNDGLVVDLDAALAADVNLGAPAVLPLCLGDRYEVTVIDQVRETRTVHCVSAAVAADLDAVVAAR